MARFQWAFRISESATVRTDMVPTDRLLPICPRGQISQASQVDYIVAPIIGTGSIAVCPKTQTDDPLVFWLERGLEPRLFGSP